MSERILEPIELRARGFEVLARSLGWVNAVRFVQQYETSKLDYTREREDMLPDWNAREMVKRFGPSAVEEK